MGEIVAVVIVCLVAIAVLVEKIRAWRTPEPGTVEYIKWLYETDEIDEREMERQLDVVLDPEADRIRVAAERCSGIGEQTSWDLAARFNSLDDVRDASLPETDDLYNVMDEALAELPADDE